jgi:hypothetical protein
MIIERARRPWYKRIWRRITGRDRMLRKAMKIIRIDRVIRGDPHR